VSGTAVINVVPFSQEMQGDVIELILTIQQREFGFEIQAEDQPDLLDVADFYQIGAGGFWVALAGAMPVGTIGLRDIGDKRGALRKMFVAAPYRGGEHGVARTLLRTLLGSARAGGIEEILLGTTEKFLAAHRFYEKHGFVRVLPNDLPASFPRMALDTRFYKLELAKMARIRQITPFLLVPNMKSALALFCETLPFVLRFRESNYAYIELDGAGLRILEEASRVLTPDEKARVTVYIDVENVDELYAQLGERLAQLPRDQVEPIAVQPWGQKEFQVRLPDGDWMTFGESAA
jgi:GNAT superfamily N-acetyltransferase